MHGGVEIVALRHLRSAAHILEGGVVGRNHPCASAALDGHIADGHAPFHRQRANDFASVLYDMAGRARHAYLADDAKHYVLGGNAGGELAVDANFHRLGLELAQSLGGKHMLYFGCADSDGESAESAVRGGVAVAAHDNLARLRVALLRPDDMHDALQRAEPVV